MNAISESYGANDKEPFVIILILFLIMNTVIVVLLFHLIALHLWLTYNKSTTFELLMYKRKKLELGKKLKEGLITREFYRESLYSLWSLKTKKKSKIIVEIDKMLSQNDEDSKNRNHEDSEKKLNY